MNGFKQYRGWLAVICIAVATLVSVQLFVTQVDAVSRNKGVAHKVFYVCSNAKSPSVLGKFTVDDSCCQGTIEERDFTAENLMKSLKTVSEAFRAVTRHQNSTLEGPQSAQDKVDCYLQSITFIVNSMKEFPPQKNVEEKAEYLKLFDQLLKTAEETRVLINTKSSNRYVLTYGYYQNTCGECHKKFR